MNEMTYDRQLVERLAEEFVERYRAGERPSLDEYVAAHPGHADEIRDLFPALVMIEELAPSEDSAAAASAPPAVAVAPLERVGDYRILREIGRGGMGVVYEAEQESLGRRVALKVLHLQAGQDPRVLARFRRESRAAAQLHHTNIVPVFEVGQEGGVCYYAMQFIQGQALDEVLQQLQKLRSAGPVLVTQALPADAGPVARSLWTGQFEPASGERQTSEESPGADAPGSPLPDASRPPAAETERVAVDATMSSIESNYRLYCRNVARIGLQVAEALAYAHARSVIHRDIKPANLLLDTAGVVWVSDFGLAKTKDPGLTDTGDIVGTVRYMAPERFQGECDARADLYALGLTLYELLVLRPAFDGQDRLHLMKQITRQEPARPRTLDPRIPRDLETVVLKALEKEPRRRYASADELADDLRRFLSDRPIQARPIRVWERALKWARRRPAVAGLTGALLWLCVILLGLGIWSYERIGQALAQETQALAQETQEREKAVAAQEVAEKKSADLLAENYRALLSATRAARLTRTPGWREGALDNLRRLAEMDTPRRDLVELRTEAVACLGERDTGPATRLLAGHNHHVGTVEFSPDGATLASVGWDGTVHLWDTASGRQLAVFRDPAYDASKTLFSPESSFNLVRFRPDGSLLCLTHGQRLDFLERKGDSQTLVRREGIGPLPGTKAPPRSLSLDAKGRLLAVGWADGVVRVYDPSGALKREVATQLRDVLRMLQPQTGKPALPLERSDVSALFPAALSPDGALLATSGPGYVVQLHTLAETKEPLLLGKHREMVRVLVFSPDGSLLASNSDDGTARLWDVRGGKEKLVLAGHSASVWDVAFSPAGDLVATASADGTARVWETQTGMPVVTLQPGPGGLFCVAFSPHGTRLAVGGASSLNVYPLPQRTERRRLATSTPICLAFQPGKAVLAVGTFSEDIHRWDLGPGRSGKSLPDLPNPSNDLSKATGLMAYSPDGRLLAMASPPPSEGLPTATDAAVHVLDAETGKVLQSLQMTTGRAKSLVFDPAGRLLAAAATDGRVRLWDVATGEVKQSWWNLAALMGGTPIAFASNGAELLVGNLAGQIVVREVSTGRTVRETALPGGLMQIAVSPDESRLAVVGADGRVRILGLPDLKLLATLEWPHERIIPPLAFAADSRLLATTSIDRKIVLWDTRAFRHLFDLPPQNNFVTCLAFQPDGFRLAVGAWEHLATVWDLALLRPELSRIGLDWDKTGPPRTPSAVFRRGQFQGLPTVPIEGVVLGANYILKAVPDQAEFTNELAWIYAAGPEKLRDAQKALPLAQKAVELAPSEPLCWNTLGVAHYRLGEWQKGLDALAKAVAVNSSGATAYDLYFLALCRHRLGQTELAKADYERALAWQERARLNANQVAELAVLRAEAAAVLAKQPHR